MKEEESLPLDKPSAASSLYSWFKYCEPIVHSNPHSEYILHVNRQNLYILNTFPSNKWYFNEDQTNRKPTARARQLNNSSRICNQFTLRLKPSSVSIVRQDIELFVSQERGSCEPKNLFLMIKFIPRICNSQLHFSTSRM